MPKAEFKYFEPTESMMSESCTFCDEMGIDLWIQLNVPGGGMLLCHRKCLDEFMGEDDAQK
jgi:hypothetical protein